MHDNRTQSVFHGVRTTFTWSLLLFTLLLAMPAMSQAATPVVFFSDLDSGPNIGGENNNGVYVTIVGNNFGSTQGTSYVTVGGGQAASYQLWSDTKIIFQLGSSAATGNIAVTTGTGQSTSSVPFTVRAGRIFFVTPTGTGNGSVGNPMSPTAFYGGIQAGDTYYFRAGTYTGNYGFQTWANANIDIGSDHQGTAGNSIAFVGYPNELVTLSSATGSNFDFATNAAPTGATAYITVANFNLIGFASCIQDGGFYTYANSGAPGVRIVNNIFSATYGNANTMTALVAFQTSHWRVWGNEFMNTGSGQAWNNNHVIYIQAGASDVDVGWNYFHNNLLGHQIQVHTDSVLGGASCYTFTDVRIHDNVLTATHIDDARGINVGNVCGNSYGSIYNNILYNLGQDFSGIAVYNGAWKIYNNTLYNIHASGTALIWVSNQGVNLPNPTIDVKNNIIYSDGLSPYVAPVYGATFAQITLSNNLYYNMGAALSQDPAAVTGDPLFINSITGDFHLQSGSPAIDSGSSTVNTVVTMDHDGAPRPQGSGYDIGAYELTGPSLPAPQNLSIRKL